MNCWDSLCCARSEIFDYDIPPIRSDVIWYSIRGYERPEVTSRGFLGCVTAAGWVNRHRGRDEALEEWYIVAGGGV